MKYQQIFNWVPEFYDDFLSLPDEMPADLKLYIKSQPQEARKQIWVSCKGEHTMDRENIGKMVFYPSQGFPGHFYPYKNYEGYVSPLIAVQFQNPTGKF